jgi:hypothetical protein
MSNPQNPNSDMRIVPAGYAVVDMNNLPTDADLTRRGTVWTFDPQGGLRAALHAGQRFFIVKAGFPAVPGDLLDVDGTRFEVLHAAAPSGYVIAAGFSALSLRELA